MAVAEANEANLIGRIVALGVAILAAWLGWGLFNERIRPMLQSGYETPLTATQLQEEATSAAVQACANERYAQIDQMVSDGFMKEDAVADARQRALAVCANQD